MSDFKLGDSVRLSTGVVAIVSDYYSDGDFSVAIEQGMDRFPVTLASDALKALGITVEKIMSPPPAEPLALSTIRFNKPNGDVRTATRANFATSQPWFVIGDSMGYSWSELVENYKFTKFELFFSEREIVQAIHRLLPNTATGLRSGEPVKYTFYESEVIASLKALTARQKPEQNPHNKIGVIKSE